MLYARFIDGVFLKFVESDEPVEDLASKLLKKGVCTISAEIVYETVRYPGYEYVDQDHPEDAVGGGTFRRTFRVKRVSRASIIAGRIKEIKAAAADAITGSYPQWKQLNIMREGGEALVEMSEFIDRVRAHYDLREKQLKLLETDDELLEFVVGGLESDEEIHAL